MVDVSNLNEHIIVAESYMKSELYSDAVCKFLEIITLLKHGSINIYFRLFDAWLSSKDYSKAHDVLVFIKFRFRMDINNCLKFKKRCDRFNIAIGYYSSNKFNNYDLKHHIAAAEHFMHTHYYDKAIEKWLFIINSLHHESVNIFFRLFDAYLNSNHFRKARILLNTTATKFNIDISDTRFADRFYLLNSFEAKRFNVSINHLKSNSLVSCHPCSKTFVKALDLEFFLFNIGLSRHINFFVIESSTSPYNLPIYPVRSYEKNNTCYYEFSLNLLNTFKIGYIVEDISIVWLVSFKCNGILSVIKGLESWLFLGNDANKSLDQFTGNTLIQSAEIDHWNLYLNSFSKLSNAVLLVPPSKEMVFPEFYPYDRAAICPIDQLSVLIRNNYNINFLYPLDLLKKDRYSYTKNETHWSYKAAYNVLLEILNKWSLNVHTIDNFFKFSLRPIIGDLGSKLENPSYSDYYVISNNFKIDDYLVFTNFKKPQQGHILKYVNNNSLFNKSLIIFGDSFGVYLLEFCVKFFRKVILVRSNATVIYDFLKHEELDFIIAEMTERYVVRSPLFVNRIIDYPPCIRKDLLDDDKFRILNYHFDLTESIYNNYLSDYKKHLMLRNSL